MKKRIAIIIMDSFFSDGRVERLTAALATENEVKVIGMNDEKRIYPDNFNGIPVELINLKTKKLSNNPFVQIFKYIEYYFKTVKAIKKYQPDLIYCNDIFTIYFGRFFKKKGIKFIYDSHELWSDSNHHLERNRKLYKILDLVEKYSIKRADAVISVGPKILEILQKRHNLSKTLLIMNIPELSEKNATCISNKNSTELLYVGAILQGRGLENIVLSSKKWNEGIHLTIIGFGALKDDLVELVRVNDLSKKVTISGSIPQSEVMDAFRKCDAGIHAIENICLNHYYCLPNKFFQITLSKKTILVSNFPEMKKIVDNYNLGYTFEPGNPANIAETINRFDKEKFQIADDDFERYTKAYSWKNEKEKLINLVKSL